MTDLANHDPASTTITELVDHVKSHLVPEVGLDHLSDYDVRALIGLTMHSLSHFGLTLVPAGAPGGAAHASQPPAASVGRIEPSVLVACDLLAGALWRSTLRLVRRAAEWLDTPMVPPS